MYHADATVENLKGVCAMRGINRKVGMWVNRLTELASFSRGFEYTYVPIDKADTPQAYFLERVRDCHDFDRWMAMERRTPEQMANFFSYI